MSKIVFLGDTHFGCRGGSKIFHDHFEKFYKEVFFPYIDKHEIKQVVQMGDIFDNRKNISIYSLHRAKDYFFNEVGKRDLTLHILMGNHDTLFKNTNEVNSPKLLLKEYENIKVYEEVAEVNIEGVKFAFLPWICKDNTDQSFHFIEGTTASILLGHLELIGFDMYKGTKAKHGLNPKIFHKFEMVLSGHYHTRSKQGNIEYLGTPYAMTWSDWNDPRGFHVFDTADRSLEFVENPNEIFHKIVYNGEAVESPNLKDCYVRVLVEDRGDPKVFAKFVEQLEGMNPASLQILDDMTEVKIVQSDDVEMNVEDTLTIIKNEVLAAEVKVSREKLENVLTDVYYEAMRTEC